MIHFCTRCKADLKNFNDKEKTMIAELNRLTKALSESETRGKELQSMFTEQLGREEKKSKALADALNGIFDAKKYAGECWVGALYDAAIKAKEALTTYAKDEVKIGSGRD